MKNLFLALAILSSTFCTAQLVVNINHTNPFCNGGTDGTATTTATGGTSPYAFLWSNGQMTGMATGLGAGMYYVTVSDFVGGLVLDSVLITELTPINLNPVQLSNYNGAAITCPAADDGSVGVVAAGGTGGFSYQWSPNSQNTPINNNLFEGTYCVTVTDVNGCTADTCITINDPLPLAATYTSVNVQCNGANNGQITVTATPGTGTPGLGGYEYSILGPGQISGWYSAINSFDSLQPGAYTVFIRDANDCEIQIPFQILEPTEVVINAVNVTNAVCFGSTTGTAIAVVSGGVTAYTYIWSNNQTTNPATGLAQGLYTVTVADGNGCTKVETFNIGEPVELIGSINANPILCFGGVTTATATGSGGTPILNNYIYYWTNGATTATAINLSEGVHCVTITDYFACTVTECITITQPSTAVSATITNQTPALCQGSATGTATAQGMGGTAPYTYLWYTTPTQTSQTVTGLMAGVYTVNITDNNGCTIQTSVTITDNLTIALNENITNINCNGGSNGSVIITGSNTSIVSYNWSNSMVGNPINNLTAGNYTVTVVDINSCTANFTYTITEPTAISAAIISQAPALCQGSATGTATAQGIDGTAPYTYLWQTTSTQTSQTATGLLAGVYSVIVTDNNGCTASASATITEPTAISVNITQTNFINCYNDNDGQLTATATGGTPNYSYQWNNGTTTSIADSLAPGTYRVTVTDSQGCKATSNYISITQPPPLTISVINNNDGTATATGMGGTLFTSPFNYLWDSNANNQTTAIATGLADSMTYSVTVTDALGCQAADTVTASVSINRITTLESFDLFPNPSSGAFYINILFKQKQEGVLEIRDILGQLILSEKFEGQDIQRQINLEKYAAGVYFVSLQVDGQVLTKKIQFIP